MKKENKIDESIVFEKVLRFHLEESIKTIRYIILNNKVKKNKPYLTDLQDEILNIKYKLDLVENFSIKDLDLAKLWKVNKVSKEELKLIKRHFNFSDQEIGQEISEHGFEQFITDLKEINEEFEIEYDVYIDNKK